jgi:hypothetical protein
MCGHATVQQRVRQCGSVRQCAGQRVVVQVAVFVCLCLIIVLFVFNYIKLNLS